MFYNSYAKKAKEDFANKVIEVICPTDYLPELKRSFRHDYSIPVFLAGGVIPGNDWRKEVVEYFQENWKEEKGIIFCNPVREGFDVNNPDDVKRQIEWEFGYLNYHDMLVSFFFPPTQYPQAMSFYELGRSLSQKTDTYVCVHKDFVRKTDVIVQGALANYGDIPHEVESVKQFAENLMSYIKQNYDTNIPIESDPNRCCWVCKYFSETPTHGSIIMGECLKKENIVDRYNGSHKDYKTVFEDEVCKFFEKKEK